MEQKPWYKSKIVWLNVVLTLSGALVLIADLLAKQAVTPAEIALLGSGILNVMLRVWFTDTPIAK